MFGPLEFLAHRIIWLTVIYGPQECSTHWNIWLTVIYGLHEYLGLWFLAHRAHSSVWPTRFLAHRNVWAHMKDLPKNMETKCWALFTKAGCWAHKSRRSRLTESIVWLEKGGMHVSKKPASQTTPKPAHSPPPPKKKVRASGWNQKIVPTSLFPSCTRTVSPYIPYLIINFAFLFEWCDWFEWWLVVS